jgi:hypothetical protein
MKAATRVPTRDSPPLLYTLSKVHRVSRVHVYDINTSKLADSWRTYRSQSDLRRPSKATHSTFCQMGWMSHHEAEWPGLDHSWHWCRVLPLLGELSQDCNSASFLYDES